MIIEDSKNRDIDRQIRESKLVSDISNSLID